VSVIMDEEGGLPSMGTFVTRFFSSLFDVLDVVSPTENLCGSGMRHDAPPLLLSSVFAFSRLSSPYAGIG